MRINYKIYFVFALLVITSCSDEHQYDTVIEQDANIEELEQLYQDLLNEPEEIPLLSRKNPKKVYVHYMPWFQSKDYDGKWGQHWTMTNRNPDIIDANGKRQIASHYYPLIGPYSSNDDDLQKYHLLLMKLAGIDGVIFDWYGSRDIHDYNDIKESTESFIKEIEEVGLEYAIMYEDRVAEYASHETENDAVRTISGIAAVAQDMEYIKSTYFTSSQYIRLHGNEMLFTFGPHFIVNPVEWDTIFQNTGMDPDIYTLWKASDRVGKYAGGEFSWIDKGHLNTLKGYYNCVRENNITAVGGAYGGFNDYYVEGGWREPSDHDWTIDHNNIEVFKQTLDLMHNEETAFIQLITWNDFGEGTMIEPTQEFGFQYLEEIQKYTNSQFTADKLELPYLFYMLKKDYPNNKRLTRLIDGVYEFTNSMQLKKARRLVRKILKHYPVDNY